MSNIWNAVSENFAERLTLGDLKGFFSKQLVVEPGTKALIIEDGISSGVVPTGTYTMQSFIASLNPFRSGKQLEVVIVRDGDVRFPMDIPQIATAEQLLVSVKLDLVLKIADVALFAKNLLGGQTRMTLEEISHWIRPIITQALRESVSRLSIAALTSPEVRQVLVTAIEDASKLSLARYGIECIDIHATEIKNERYDEQRQKIGEIFLLETTTEQQKKLDEVLNKETLAKISQRECEIELDVLSQNVEVDAEEADIAVKVRRCEVLKKLRDVNLSDEFDKLQSDEEFKAFRLEIDKQGLLREDEWHEFQQVCQAKQEDRESAREHLVKTIELRRNAELDEIATTIAQAQKVAKFKNEIEMSKLTDSEENRKWRLTLEKEIETTNHQHLVRMTKLKQDQEWNEQNGVFLDATELRELLHRQKAERIRLETEEDSAAREVRIQGVKDEYAIVHDRNKHALQMEKQADKLKILERLQEMDRERQRFELEMVLKTQSQAHTEEINRMNALAQMGVEQQVAYLISTGAVANAEWLAKWQMSKQDTTVQQEIMKAREESLRNERELQEKRVLDAQNATAMVSDTIQKITGQAFAALGQFGGAPGMGGVPVSGAVIRDVPHDVVCSKCQAQNARNNKCCSNCGKQL